MDPESKKRSHTIRVIITEIFMVIAGCLLVIILTFVAMGYNFSLNGSIDQSGLLQINSLPTGATITIDGEEIFYRTNTSRMLEAGTHTVKLTRDGYDSWEKQIEISPGILTQVEYPRLFRNNRESETLEDFTKLPTLFSASPSHTRLLYAQKNSREWSLRNIENNSATISKIDLAKILPESWDISELAWSDDASRLTLKISSDYYLINLARPESSLNLTDEFDMKWTKLSAYNSSGETLFGLENNNLRVISTGTREVSRVLISDVATFDNLGENIIYVTTSGEIGLYRLGETTPIPLKTNTESKIKVAISKYLDQDFLTIAEGPLVTVYRGNLSTSDFSLDKMDALESFTLNFSPTKLYRYNNGRIIVAQNDTSLSIFDSERKTFSSFQVNNPKIFFLDNYLIATVENNSLTVRDFDGTNLRTLTSATPDFPAVISSNNDYLYKVDNSALVRERL
ncbi:MAG: PEGA domain-containing protein [Candidatus Saccharibacteria bacterium]|nr:PEGA domain-containing protein [Candidatus Saccharibacteria bacterium]